MMTYILMRNTTYPTVTIEPVLLWSLDVYQWFKHRPWEAVAPLLFAELREHLGSGPQATWKMSEARVVHYFLVLAPPPAIQPFRRQRNGRRRRRRAAGVR